MKLTKPAKIAVHILVPYARPPTNAPVTTPMASEFASTAKDRAAQAVAKLTRGGYLIGMRGRAGSISLAVAQNMTLHHSILRRASTFVMRSAIFILTASIVLSFPFMARAQDSGAAQSPAMEDTVESGQPPQPAPTAESGPAGAASQPAAPVEAIPPPASLPAEIPSALDAAGSTQPKAIEAPSSGMTAPAASQAPAVTETGPEPAPSLLEDPATAISQMLEPAGRDPKLPHDLSPWGMFTAADRVVKAVMIGLAFASLVTWTIWLAKSVEIACAKARVKRALKVIADAPGISDAAHALAGRGGPAAFMVRRAESEMDRSEDMLDHVGSRGLSNRVLSHLVRIEAQAGRRLSRGTGVLATIGSTAPFVGLFGTVWGIMNAFIGISQAQTTNLAVVAPGIAEALLATAFGLVAAIPAVVIYNVFARSIAGYKQLLADASAAVERLVSLDLDRSKIPARPAPSALAAG